MKFGLFAPLFLNKFTKAFQSSPIFIGERFGKYHLTYKMKKETRSIKFFTYHRKESKRYFPMVSGNFHLIPSIQGYDKTTKPCDILDHFELSMVLHEVNRKSFLENLGL